MHAYTLCAGTFAAAAAARVPGLARLFVSVAFEKGNHYDEPSKYQGVRTAKQQVYNISVRKKNILGHPHVNSEEEKTFFGKMVIMATNNTLS